MMRTKFYVITLLTCILFLQGFEGSLSADTLVMPRELVDFGHANGCAPIDNFFERPGMVNPPFVYGWISGDPARSAVFWCKKTETSDKLYKLIFKTSDPTGMVGCPATIEWWNPPRGLSIETRPRLVLDDFKYVTDPTRPGPKSVIVNAKVLVNEYDGVGNVFYCDGGRWLFSSFE
jgi:hypothetical protein